MTDKITIARALLQQALETLEGCYITFHEDDGIAEAINAIRAALAATQPAQAMPDKTGTDYSKLHAKWRKAQQELANLNRAHERLKAAHSITKGPAE